MWKTIIGMALWAIISKMNHDIFSCVLIWLLHVHVSSGPTGKYHPICPVLYHERITISTCTVLLRCTCT